MRTTLVLAVALGAGACGGEAPGGTGGSSGAGSTGATGESPTGESPTGDATSIGEVTGSSSGGEVVGTSSGGEVPGTSSGGAGESTTGEVAASSTGDEPGTTGGVACAPAVLGAGDHVVMLEHGGMMRSARVHVPASVDLAAPTPLVLNFHGFSSNASQQELFSGMNATADAEGFVVVYPEGILSSWNAGACCGTAMMQGLDDVGFVRALVSELHAQLCIDARRVYATGMSNGGFMSHRLACEASDVFAAVAPVSAVNGMDDCAPGRPVPVMMFNGTADGLVDYNGAGQFQSVKEAFDGWAERDACVDAPKPGLMKGATSCLEHQLCDADVSVVSCTHEGMGHCWPGQAFCPFGMANTDISANDEMWKFFGQYVLP